MNSTKEMRENEQDFKFKNLIYEKTKTIINFNGYAVGLWAIFDGARCL